MVVYNLSCDNEHTFEGWFDSAESFDAQVGSETISCPVCGSCGIARKPAAPNIVKQRQGSTTKNGQDEQIRAFLALQAQVMKFVTENTEDVGNAFPEEARRIHRQEAPDRAIRGQATAKDAEALREEGIDVLMLPLPAIPRDQLH